MLDKCTANNGRINSRGYYPRPDTMARLKGGAPAIRLICGAPRIPLWRLCRFRRTIPLCYSGLTVPTRCFRFISSGAVTALLALAPTALKENTLSTHHSPYGWGAQDLNAARMSRQAPPPRKVPLQRGLLIEDINGWVGEVVKAERIGGALFFGLEDAKGRVKNFPLGPGYLIEGEPVEIVAPVAAKEPKRTISRSGSIAVKNAPARVARASRIWVEGLHDAELVEKVWGHDLRVEGIVVEPLHGVDDLAGAIREFAPGPGRRLGILVDHLIEGTKEQRIVAEALAVPGAAGHVKIVGHPFIDIWQAVKPSVLGLKAWPQVPRGEDFKKGTLRRLGQPHETQADVAQAWKHILSRVDSYADLDPTLLGPVESLIDFLTEPGA